MKDYTNIGTSLASCIHGLQPRHQLPTPHNTHTRELSASVQTGKVKHRNGLTCLRSLNLSDLMTFSPVLCLLENFPTQNGNIFLVK